MVVIREFQRDELVVDYLGGYTDFKYKAGELRVECPGII